MSTDNTDDETLETLAEYLRLNPDATTPEVLGATDTDPSVWGDVVEDALATAEPHLALETPDTGAPEGDSRNANPGCETDKPGSSTPDEADGDTDLSERAHAAFADAVEFYHRQLDTELPVEYADTARDYYENIREWTPDTVDEKLLGYAPGDCRDELITFLYDRGHDRDAIQASGLFYEGGLKPHFNGRFVLPYFDEDGDPVYAISRSIDEDNGGHPNDHHGDQKYTKVIKGQDYSVMDEPIYGLSTVDEDTDRLLVAGGIADAITLHEAGYGCISPVTTVRFKSKHEDRVLELAEEYGIDAVYMLNDAERPTVDARETDEDEHDRIGDVLTIQSWGEGLRGAFGNAEFLQDADVETHLVDLPAGDDDLRKLDPDDYVKEGWGSVETVLSSAKPVGEDVEYRRWKESQRSRAVSEAKRNDGAGASSDGDASALFGLNFTEVSDLSDDYRGKNPLGHHGESENYFVVIDEADTDLGYDHKYGAAYNALTYLLVDANERRASSPGGRLTDEEVFIAWKHAKEEGHITEDDPIPLKALQYVARDATEWDGELVEKTTGDGDTFEGLPSDVYNAALEGVREEYDLEPGRHPVGKGDDAEHTAVLPPAVRELTTASTGWDWRHTAERDDATLTVDDARERTVDAIADAYERGDRVLVEALPTMGKSYGAVKAAADTDEQITVLTGRGRKEQYAQFKQWCDEHGLTYKELPSFTHDCPTAAGEHGEDWRETVMNWYRRGATPQQIHNQAEYVLDRPLPCQVAEDGTHIDCEYRHAWNFDPDNNPDTGEPYDVLIGHYVHAHTEQATAGRTVVFDEFPDAYETDLGTQLQGAVSYWLEATDGVPFDSYTDLVENRDDQRRRGEALLWFEEHGVDTDGTHVFDDESAHAAAPLAVFTLLASDDLGNGFERADLDDAGTGLFTDGRDHVDRNPRIHLIRPPALDYASGVVALDGTPTKRMWELALGEQLNHREVLQDGEKIEYVRDALNLNIVRTTEYVKPYNSGDHVNTDQDAALLEAIADQHGEAPAVISTTTALEEYDAEGVLTLDRNEHDALTGGVIDGHARRVKWHGNVLGSNEFDDTRLGAVIGSNHYGDGFIKKWGAYAGEAVERNDEKGQDLSYGGFGDEVHDHMTEHDTLQAAMRFGRDGNGAVVYVHTDTLPDWVPLAGEARVLKTWSDGKRDVLEALEDLREPTTAAVVDHPAVDLSRQQVFDHLEDLRERGLLSREQDPEDGRRVVWLDDGLHRVNEHGDVDFEPVELEDLTEEEVRKLARNSVYTWEFTNFSDEDADSLGEATAEVSTPSRGATTGGDRPPNDAD